MKLGHKLLLAPVITALAVLAVGQVDSFVLSRASQSASDAFREHMGEVGTLNALQGDVNGVHVDVYRMMTIIGSLDEAAIQGRRKDLQSRIATMKGTLDKQINKEPEGTDIRKALTDSRAQLDQYVKSADSAVDLASVDPNTGVAAMQGADEAYKRLTETMNKTSAALIVHASADAEEQGAAAQRNHWLFSLLSVLSAAVVVGLAWLVLRKVAASLDQAAKVARSVAAGDLTQRVDTDRNDELGELLKALAAMKDSLLKTVAQVRSASDNIGTASAQIASGNQDLSARTEQTASSLQQTAASMEELTSTVRQSADAARQANQLAASASEIAVRGGQVVNQVVHTMEEINHSSKKISDIIGTIDGIAFQTNILALNAAVEAARAGEQGRGFAVVAAEVRNLAQRSAEAAREIKGLIGSSVDKVEEGTRLVGDAGQTMGEIVASVQRVTDIIGEITAAAGEQSDGIGQVNVAVTQLDQMTQQNAALVEESAAAAESLKDQATRLSQVVQVFRIDGTTPVVQLKPEPAPVRAAPAKVASAPLAAPRPAPSKPVASAPRALPAAPAPTPKPQAVAVASGTAEGDWESF
ncbi:methyl-accepting chemotaxis protein [Hydrogenophaga sp. RWCD_12]|uniref:methyl-accepting chemotaxis protein n=1 Tax=Hydrogenophaga sp. RWCD_12 TaxID=3391190 RepID=UPI003984D565